MPFGMRENPGYDENLDYDNDNLKLPAFPGGIPEGRGVALGDEGSLKTPDGAFAPSETVSPDLRAHTNGRRRNERSGRGECPVPPRLLGHTPPGSRIAMVLWRSR